MMDIEQNKIQQDLPWIEKYRPNSLDEMISHTSIIQTLNKFIENENLPNLLFYGPPGTGKTSTIVSCARKLYGNQYKQMVLELNASDDRGINVVREDIKNFASMSNISLIQNKSLTKVKLIILDEADEMTSDAQFALRRILEKYSKVCRFCMICNFVSKIIPALQSRCTRFKFKNIDYDDAQQRILQITHSENLNIDQEALKTVFKICEGDMRKTVNMLQSLSLQNQNGRVIDSNYVYQMTGNIHPDKVKEIFQVLTTFDLKKIYYFLLQISNEGISLNILIKELTNILVQQEIIRDKQLAYILIELANLEYRLSLDCSDKIQMAGLASIFIASRSQQNNQIILQQ